MHFLIEKPYKEVTSSPKKNGQDGRWFFVRQDALIFKEGESYPDKYTLTLLITDNESEANNKQAYPQGEYVIPDEAFVIQGRNLRIAEGKLKPRNAIKEQKAA